MKHTLDYARPSTKQYHPLKPALLVALIGCPVASIVAGLLGCQLALGCRLLPPTDLGISALCGAIGGGLGGLVIASITTNFRARAMPISIIGLFLLSALHGGAQCFVIAALMAY